VISSHRPYNEF